MSILLFILVFIFAIILIIFSVFGKVLSFLFRGFRGRSNQRNSENMGGRNKTTGSQQYSQPKTEETKVFADNEGEYVSYEEIEE